MAPRVRRSNESAHNRYRPRACVGSRAGYDRSMRKLHEDIRQVRVPSEVLARWSLDTPVVAQETTGAALAFLVYVEHASIGLLPVPTILQSDQAVPQAVGTSGKTYTVQAGDTLNKIAREHLGDGNAFMKIFNENQDQLTDPDRITPGQVLKLP